MRHLRVEKIDDAQLGAHLTLLENSLHNRPFESSETTGSTDSVSWA